MHRRSAMALLGLVPALALAAGAAAQDEPAGTPPPSGGSTHEESSPRAAGPPPDPGALRDEAIALYGERCGAEEGSTAREQAPMHWEMLIRLGYTPERLVELARDLPEGCGYTSFRSALLAEDHGVADQSARELAGISGGGDGPSAAGGGSAGDASPPADDDSRWKVAMQRRIGRYALGWIVPLAVVDGGCRSALIVFFEDNPFTAVMPYATVGTLALISGATALGTLGGIRHSVELATSREALRAELTRKAVVAYGLAGSFVAAGGTVFSSVRLTGFLGIVIGVGCMIVAVPIFHAAVTLSVLRDDIDDLDVDAELARRRRQAHRPRIVAVSPLGIAGVW